MSRAPRAATKRTCFVCRKPWPGVTHGWDWHAVGEGKARRFVDTCSAECRRNGGYPERFSTV